MGIECIPRPICQCYAYSIHEYCTIKSGVLLPCVEPDLHWRNTEIGKCSNIIYQEDSGLQRSYILGSAEKATSNVTSEPSCAIRCRIFLCVKLRFSRAQISGRFSNISIKYQRKQVSSDIVAEMYFKQHETTQCISEPPTPWN